MLSLIVAMDPNRCIGRDGKLPWHVPQDLKLFKNYTMGHRVVMGRITADSLPGPLPGREILVISHHPHALYPVIDDPKQWFARQQETNEHIYVAGGAAIYELALPYAYRLVISKMHQCVEGDRFFPEFDESSFRLVTQINYPDFDHLVYEKR